MWGHDVAVGTRGAGSGRGVAGGENGDRAWQQGWGGGGDKEGDGGPRGLAQRGQEMTLGGAVRAGTLLLWSAPPPSTPRPSRLRGGEGLIPVLVPIPRDSTSLVREMTSQPWHRAVSHQASPHQDELFLVPKTTCFLFQPIKDKPGRQEERDQLAPTKLGGPCPSAARTE